MAKNLLQILEKSALTKSLDTISSTLVSEKTDPAHPMNFSTISSCE
jgi:hypothetical protein